MGIFWLGFVLGFLVLFVVLVLLVALALFDAPGECDAQRVAREVRAAKRRIDRIFAETRRKMEDAKDSAPSKTWKEYW